MAQDLNVITALAEDWGAVSSTHIQWVTTPYIFSSRGSDTLYWPLWTPIGHL